MINRSGANSTPSKEAKNWTDFTPDEARNKRLITISLIVLSIVIAAGIAIATYYCCTTTQSVTNNAGHVVQHSNASLSVFPIILGGFALAGTIGGSVCLHLFYGRTENPQSRDDLHKDFQNAKTLEKAYQQFNRNIRPLLLEQILFIEDAKELRSIFAEYAEILPIKGTYDSLSQVERKEVDKYLDKYPLFKAMKEKETELQAQWKQIYNQHCGESDDPN